MGSIFARNHIERGSNLQFRDNKAYDYIRISKLHKPYWTIIMSYVYPHAELQIVASTTSTLAEPK